VTQTTSGRALLLDLDGTLADSLAVMRLVYGRFLDSLGRAATDAEFARLNGPPLADVVRLLKQAHRLPQPVEELLTRYRDLIDRAYLEVRPAAGARALLEHARKLGYTVAVVTSNSAGRARDWLERVELGRLVDVLVAEEDVTRGKPAPDPYLLATARTGCTAAASIAVEDSPQGARAARDAGLRTFVLAPDPVSGPTWPAGAEPIPSLSDLAGHL
jgi:HAD superfamily hydrolase (TIGR01509 family)